MWMPLSLHFCDIFISLCNCVPDIFQTLLLIQVWFLNERRLFCFVPVCCREFSPPALTFCFAWWLLISSSDLQSTLPIIDHSCNLRIPIGEDQIQKQEETQNMLNTLVSNSQLSPTWSRPIFRIERSYNSRKHSDPLQRALYVLFSLHIPIST